LVAVSACKKRAADARRPQGERGEFEKSRGAHRNEGGRRIIGRDLQADPQRISQIEQAEDRPEECGWRSRSGCVTGSTGRQQGDVMQCDPDDHL